MEIFPLESEIANLIESKIQASCDVDVQEKTVAAIAGPAIIASLKPNVIDRDCIWSPAILVTTNWNKNDDVFTPEETFAARFTPVNKPVNWQHNGTEEKNEVIGMINSAITIDDSYQPIDKPISKFHIAIGMVVWATYFSEYAERIQNEFEDGKLFVSMECLIGNFGYALKDATGMVKLVSRDQETAKLTKYLRIYGGPGQVTIRGKEYKIGRWVKNITFSGVGYVNKPANPESIILSEPHFAHASEKFISDILTDSVEDCVLNNISKGEQMSDKKPETVKADELVAKLEAEKADLLAKISNLEASMDKIKCQMDDMNKEKECAATKAKEIETDAIAAKAALELATASINDKETKMKELAENLKKAEATLNDIEKVNVAKARFEQIKDMITVTDENKTVAELKDMDEKVFAQLLTYVKSVKKTAEVETQTLEQEVAKAESKTEDKLEENASKNVLKPQEEVKMKIDNLKKLVEENYKSRNKTKK